MKGDRGYDHRDLERVYADEGEDWDTISIWSVWTCDHLPPWAQLQRSCVPWKQVLDDLYVDGTAQQGLFLLGARDHLGWAYANSIIWHLQNRRYDNPSHWVHNAVSTARSEISLIDSGRQESGLVGKGKAGFEIDPR